MLYLRHVSPVQRKDELEELYSSEDPWDYDTTPDDARRVARLLAHLPRQDYARTLDIGCGNGFLTVRLPGEHVHGIDVSERAVGWARARARREAPRRRVLFDATSLFELSPAQLGVFDLVVVTGVLYPQYVGGGTSVVTELLSALLHPGGILVSVHIDAWCRYRPPFTLLSASIDPYREHFHRLEVFAR
jgi:2-polyprenyl-3-methyl-5-hydroxy-6-metoxy-1,4-benzoquinol methylase